MIDICFVDYDNRTIARIDVPKGFEPVYYADRIAYLRDISEARPASASEIKNLHRNHFRMQQ
jgi:predicted HTH transcriptional regulator